VFKVQEDYGIMAIKIQGHPLLFWLWIFSFLFFLVIAGSQIFKLIKKDFSQKQYNLQYLAFILFFILVGVLHYYYPFARFWKELRESPLLH
jgi:hypothetical protein